MELYYYTTTDTMRYILENGDIFATNIRYMNDSEEYINGLEGLWKLANNREMIEKWQGNNSRKDILTEDIQKVFTRENLTENQQDMEYYSISFCEKNDLLSQWAIYAKESGVSIKMDFGKGIYNFSATSTEDGEKTKWGLSPEKVYYFTYDSAEGTDEEWENTAFEILEKLYPKDSLDLVEGKKENWKYISAFIKRHDFYQEAERRLVFRPGAAAFPPLIEYRMDKKVLKPYIDVVCENGWPITEIMIGPGFNQQVVYDSVIHFMEHVKVMIGIQTAEDYIDRIKGYFKAYEDEFTKCKAYQNLEKCLSDTDMICSARLEDIQRVFTGQIKNICKEINHGNGYSREMKTYINNNYFTSCGVVISKSSIPYIF